MLSCTMAGNFVFRIMDNALARARALIPRTRRPLWAQSTNQAVSLELRQDGAAGPPDDLGGTAR